MASKNSFDEKIMIDNNLSNRYIDLDPNGYFIIKVDLEENKIILEPVSYTHLTLPTNSSV